MTKSTQLPRLIHDLQEWSDIKLGLQSEKRSVGFVPTMGALHEGHATLLHRSRAENDFSVLSIYVNPTQFDNKADLEKYPETLAEDQFLAAREGVDYILAPTYPQIYPDGYRYKVSESEFSRKLCGAHRPGHFDGVLTVVLKLLNLVTPDRAYFGEKDFQQLQLVKEMASSFFLKTGIVACPTMRESDGLAMSSRNVRLTAKERELAPAFYRALMSEPSAQVAREKLQKQGFQVDYVEDLMGRRFGAVQLGSVRLIDNVQR
jgi:pantoate--beta-alanine ligase